MKWLRLWTDLLDDPKIKGLTDLEFRVFVCLLCFASECEKNGNIPHSLDDISWRLRLQKSDLEPVILSLKTQKILIQNTNGIKFKNWKKRQPKSDNVLERVKKFRQKRNVTRNVTETLHETDQNRTEQSRAEQIKKTSKEKVVSLPPWLDEELWNDFKDHRKKLGKPMTKRAEELVIKKAEFLKGKGHNPRHLMLTAIESGWQTVYEPKS